MMPSDRFKIEIVLEPSGGEVSQGAGHIGVEVGVRFPDGVLMWHDADDGFITREEEPERGTAFIFDSVADALDEANAYILTRLREAGWG